MGLPTGTKDDPYTCREHGHAALKWCKCQGCGTVAQCTPTNDYYRRPDAPGLWCEPCLLAANGITKLVTKLVTEEDDDGQSD